MTGRTMKTYPWGYPAKSLPKFLIFAAILSVCGCSSSWKAFITKENGEYKILLNENNFLGHNIVGSKKRFCLYFAHLYDGRGNVVWKISARGMKCHEMAELNATRPPDGYDVAGNFKLLPKKNYQIKMSVSGGTGRGTFRIV